MMNERPISNAELLYLDYNCFQRGFDDTRQVRIQMEALACQEIFDDAEAKRITLIWAFIHEDESLLCPYPSRRQETLRLATLCTVRVGPEAVLRSIALSFQQREPLSAKDAVHLACAVYARASAFITCDDRLIKLAKRLKLEIAIMNPIDYVRRKGE